MNRARFACLGAALALACVAGRTHANDVVVTVSGGALSGKGDDTIDVSGATVGGTTDVDADGGMNTVIQ